MPDVAAALTKRERLQQDAAAAASSSSFHPIRSSMAMQGARMKAAATTTWPHKTMFSLSYFLVFFFFLPLALLEKKFSVSTSCAIFFSLSFLFRPEFPPRMKGKRRRNLTWFLKNESNLPAEPSCLLFLLSRFFHHHKGAISILFYFLPLSSISLSLAMQQQKREEEEGEEEKKVASVLVVPRPEYVVVAAKQSLLSLSLTHTSSLAHSLPNASRQGLL